MRKIYAPIAFALVLSAAVGTFITLSSNKSGAPDGRSGSPGDSGGTCATCHGSSPTTMANLVTTDIPGTGYVPGQTYNITISGDDGRTRYGFQLSSEISGGSKVGTFTSSSATNLLPSGNITHDNTSIDFGGTTATWVIPWTAPSVGTGDVTFYATMLAADGNGGTSGSGDQVFKNEVSVTEGAATDVAETNSLKLKVYPNPTTDLLKLSSNGIIEAYKIYDGNGSLVQSKNNVNFNQANIIVSSLPSGHYIVNVIDENGNQTHTSFIKR